MHPSPVDAPVVAPEIAPVVVRYRSAVEFLALGPLELRRDGAAIALRRGRPRRLLLALLVRHGEPVATDLLIEQLWTDDRPQNAANALQVVVSYLRTAIGTEPACPAIETVDGGYRLVVDRNAVDVYRFEDAVVAARETDDLARRIDLLDAALAQWRGSPLAEATYDDFARGEIGRLEQLRLDALQLRVDALLALGRDDEVIGPLQQLVVEHPLHERFHERLMLALYRTGRQADALRVYDRARDVLLDELGLDPGAELRDLHGAILRQDPSLAAPSPPAPSRGDTLAAPPDDVGAPADTSSQLPVGHGELVGRRDDVTRVRELLRPGRVLTLTGPGGSGKSRIALEVAAHAGMPVWWVDLANATDDVLSPIAAALGVTALPDATADALATLARELQGAVVLDTCEHVVEVVRPVVDALGRHAPGLCVLATSRQPLRVDGEMAWPVSPLGLPDPHATDAATIGAAPAVALFCARAADVQPNFALDDRNAADVARITLLLDGLPLALELAAAHAAVLAPATIVRLLDDRLRLDGGERAGRRSRRATIEWSYDLLAPDEATFLARLSVFAVSFSVEVAVLVAGDGLATDALTLLLSLARQSLVAAADDDRFRLLDTIRAYAAERLDDADAAAARDRAARWYADLATTADRGMRGSDAEGWVGELRRELANVRAALVWSFDGGDARVGARLAASMSWFWSIEGLFGEAARWLERARAVAETGSALHADIETGLAVHAASLGRLDDALDHTDAALRTYAGVDGDERVALLYRGVALWGLGRLDDAAAAHERAIDAARARRDDWGLALNLVLAARTAADRGDPDLEERLDVAIAVARRAGDPHVVALALEQRARLALRSGDRTLARDLAAASLANNERIGYDEGIVASLYILGLATDDPDVAATHDRRALRSALAQQHQGAIADGLEALAVARIAAADALGAARLLGAADGIRTRESLPRTATQADLVASVSAAIDDALDSDPRRTAAAAGRALDVRDLLDERVLADTTER
jgi:predicted ATPase/DNA-binding SARP family transcriptional activator